MGDFFDLMKMVDWAVATGQKFLPDTPYQRYHDDPIRGPTLTSQRLLLLSRFIHLYVRLEQLGRLSDKGRMQYYEDLRRELNNVKSHCGVRACQQRQKRIHARNFLAENRAVTHSTANRSGNSGRINGDWLRPYAAFCVLRDINPHSRFQQVGQTMPYTMPLMVEEFMAAHGEGCRLCGATCENQS